MSTNSFQQQRIANERNKATVENMPSKFSDPSYISLKRVHSYDYVETLCIDIQTMTHAQS